MDRAKTPPREPNIRIEASITNSEATSVVLIDSDCRLFSILLAPLSWGARVPLQSLDQEFLLRVGMDGKSCWPLNSLFQPQNWYSTSTTGSSKTRDKVRIYLTPSPFDKPRSRPRPDLLYDASSSSSSCKFKYKLI